jgi:pimeloyl-ACP methyl ester carboxylesterase
MPTLKLDDVELSYVQNGDGPDIVWIPGGDQRGVHFAEQYEAFPDFRNTAYDPRGVGETISHEGPPWTTVDFARDCAALIRAVCDPPVVLIGLSMGSLIVQQLVLDYPELIKVAIPMGTGGGGRNKAPGDWMRAEIDYRRNGGEISGPMAVHHYAAFMYPSEVLGDDELWKKCRPIVASAYEFRDSDMLIAQWELCFTFEGFDKLRECKVPLHVIAFSHDMQTPPPSGRAVAEAAGDGHFHLLEGLGHVSLLGHRPAQVSAKIREIIGQYD